MPLGGLESHARRRRAKIPFGFSSVVKPFRTPGRDPTKRQTVNLLSLVVCWTLSLSANGPIGTVAQVDALSRTIPPRPQGAPTGSQFAQSISTLDTRQREQAILGQVLKGNVPTFLRRLVPVELTSQSVTGRALAATIFVMPDYLAVGSDEDFLRTPMNLETATAIAARFGFVLPTRKMVDAIYAQASYHFVPEPLTPGPRMRSTEYYRRHNEMIERQFRAAGISRGALVSGDKKDVVVTNLLTRTQGRLAIYGWHRPDGAPIQPLSTVHGACYADYSHGIRLVSGVAVEGGTLRSVDDILHDSALANTLSDEGVIPAGGLPAGASRTGEGRCG